MRPLQSAESSMSVRELQPAPPLVPGSVPMADSAQLWSAAHELVERARRPADLRAHGLRLLAAARHRALGRPVSEEVAESERRAAMTALAVPALLQRARSAYAGQMMVMKGPEVGLRSPDPALRPFKDIDLLV